MSNDDMTHETMVQVLELHQETLVHITNTLNAILARLEILEIERFDTNWHIPEEW